MTRILLLLTHQQDRQVVATHLAYHFDICVPVSDAQALAEPFDLCLIDGPVLERLGDALQARKTAAAPHFLPIVLLIPQYDMRRLTPQVRERVDEVISIPTDTALLLSRIAILVRTRQLQQELRESEALFRSLADNANAIIGIVQGTKIVYVNTYFAHLNGYSMEESLALDIRQVIAPRYLAMVVERVRLRQAGEPSLPSRYEFAIVTKDGQERWLDFAAALTAYQGQPAIIGIAYDITERRFAEEERERLMAELDAIFTAIGDPILLFDPTATVMRTNTAATDFAGQEIIGRTHAELAAALTIRHPDGQIMQEEESPVVRATQGAVVMNAHLRITNSREKNS